MLIDEIYSRHYSIKKARRDAHAMKESYSTTRGLLERVFNVRYWMDLDRAGTGVHYILSQFRQLFSPQNTKISKKNKQEAFDHVQKTFGLSDEVVLKQSRRLRLWAIIMVLFSCALIAVAVHYLRHGLIMASIMSFVMVNIAWVLAFRYHFLSFEMKERRLGCTVGEWFKQGLLGRKK